MPSISEIHAKIRSVAYWHHRIEVAPGIITPGASDTPELLRLLDLPQHCTGLRVLDIGARDGFFSFECERRGAEVVAVDYVSGDETGFNVARELLGSKLELIQENLYDLSPAKYGKFHIVLFLGVLYHVRDPLLALDIIRSLTMGHLYLETHVIDESFLLNDGSFARLSELAPDLTQVPLMQFFPKDSFKGDYTSYWGPNRACVERMLEEANFSVTRKVQNGDRAILQCRVNDDSTLEYFTRIARGVTGSRP